MVFNKYLIASKFMKVILLTFFLLFLFLKSNSQTKEWQTYDLDSIVYLDLPFDVYEIDSIIDNKRYYEIYSSNDSSSFVAQKFYFDATYADEEMPTLPYNYESLKTFYLDLIWTFEEVSEYKMDDFNAFKLQNLTGYKVNFTDKNNVLVQQMILIYVNKNFYIFSYTDISGLKEVDKDEFFNNIHFDDTNGLKQYPNKTNTILKKIPLVLFPILFLSFILSILSKRKKRLN
ncbi:hypothetical protein BW723_11235 [Polaribacter reichenbachii]|uniref:Uncharacterized protein n=2 Tax=Polaribacter reichenbachii TaxID=996801 RepID=A0A1B8TPV9_9FLAO|nr:hypothetical protein BW723_11235 [Polaribacter reichenbachii]AUC17463.1 hypothetical protein BTO17_01680 [Polaribacter reichenbachii]OBY61661.1 hypothetical protein LPB301_16530 [Polaribacter reichenbachii]